MARANRKAGKFDDLLKRAELRLEKKQRELERAKRLHRKVAAEFIDLWMETRKLKRKKLK